MLFMGPFILEHVPWCTGSHIIYWEISVAKVGALLFPFSVLLWSKSASPHHINLHVGNSTSFELEVLVLSR